MIQEENERNAAMKAQNRDPSKVGMPAAKPSVSLSKKLAAVAELYGCLPDTMTLEEAREEKTGKL